MTDSTHEKRIKKIEAECVEIKKQIMQLEFQNKKDLRELEKRAKELNLDPVIEKEVTPNLAKFQVPTLILWGANDPYVPLDVGKSLDTVIPNDEFPVVLNTGHYELEERPEETRAMIKEFLETP